MNTEDHLPAPASSDRSWARFVAASWRDDLGDAPTAGLGSSTSRMIGWKIVATAAGAVFAIVAARQLGPAGRGVLALLLTLASVALLFCSLGITTSGRIHLPVATDGLSSGDYLGLATVLVVFQCCICLLCGVTVLPLVGARLTTGQELLFGAAGATLLAQYLLNNLLNAYGLPSLAAAVDAGGSLVQLGALLAVLAFGGRSVGSYLAAFAVANVSQTLLALFVVRHRGFSIRPRSRLPQWRLLVKSGLPAIFLDAGQVLTFRLDRYLVAAFMTPGAVGIYSVAATGPELLRLPALALGQPMLHRVATGVAVPGDLRRVRVLSAIATVAMVAAAWALAPWGVHLVFGARYETAVAPFRVLLLAELGITVFNIDGAILAGLNRVPDAAKAAIVGLCLVVAADVLLIPSHGLVGAAWSSAFAYSVMGLGAHLLLRRYQATLGGNG